VIAVARDLPTRSRFSPRSTLHRAAFATAGFGLNLERCKVTSMLEGSQNFALSLLEHNFDSSGSTVEVKSKVFVPAYDRSISWRYLKGVTKLARA
jgi:hypothetical protein